MKNSPLIVIVGQTASGKSSLAMKVAREFEGEIIAADSRTVYKGMDIGTAKPSQQDMNEITHHGINVVEPNQRFTAAQFKALALNSVDDIRKRNKLPIIVGGTGLYVDGVLFDYSFSDDADVKIRRSLNNKDLPELVKMAEKAGISVDNQVLKNKRHLIRLIERGMPPEQDRKQPENTLIVGLNPTRSRLRNNIEKRVETMFRAGLRHEVSALVTQYGWNNEALSGIGYREFKAYYKGEQSMSEVKKRIVQNTISKLAKAQRTWFKRNPYIEWFDNSDSAYMRIKQYLQDNKV